STNSASGRSTWLRMRNPGPGCMAADWGLLTIVILLAGRLRLAPGQHTPRFARYIAPGRIYDVTAARVSEISCGCDVAHMDMDAGCDRGVRPHRHGHRHHEARLSNAVATQI